MIHSLLAFYKIELVPFFKSCFKSRTDNLILMLTIIMGAYVRLYFIDQPMRVDESATFIDYVNKGWSEVWHYKQPNNHVLHTILVKIYHRP
jgi:hypothetical protein